MKENPKSETNPNTRIPNCGRRIGKRMKKSLFHSLAPIRLPETDAPQAPGLFLLCIILGLAVFGLTSCSATAGESVLYENNFEKEEVGKVPADFMVLDGGFAVKEESGNKFLELPGAPLDSFAVQFGPTESSNICVSARIFATAKGRRFPTFGVGLDGVAGYKLQAAPGKKLIELLKDQKVLASASYDWKSGEWLNFRLQVLGTGDSGWKIEGKVWSHANPEPSAWMITADEKEEPLSGRPSVFGSPFSGTPIWFDDLRVEKPAPK
jgi:hypothetical protein